MTPTEIAAKLVVPPQQVDERGVPTSIDIMTEQGPNGLIPSLNWGPIEVRRPGWTQADQDRVKLEMATLLLKLGLSTNEVAQTMSEYLDMIDQVWWAAVLKRPRPKPSLLKRLLKLVKPGIT